jgi:hypothetical protein
VRFELPFLKEPLVVAAAQVNCIVRVSEVGGDEPLLARDVRRLDLVASIQDANTVFLFDPLLHIDRFTYGAENGTRISARERRRGCDIDCLGVMVDDPDALQRSASAAGYRTRKSVSAALTNVFGAATGERAEQRRSALRRSRLRAGAIMVAWGLVFAVVFSVRLAIGRGANAKVDVGEVVGSGVAAAACALLIGFGTLVVGGSASPRVRPVRDRPSGRHALRYIAMPLGAVLVPILLAVMALRSGVVARPFALGLAGGVPGGVLTALGLRAAFRAR